MSEEWGPWIEHDGKGCPCLGAWARTERVGLNIFPSTGTRHAIIEGRILEPANWDWSRYGELMPGGTSASKILRYRIRKPRALQDLIKLVEELPEGVEA